MSTIRTIRTCRSTSENPGGTPGDDSSCPKHRLFIALPLPEVVKDDLWDVVRELNISKRRPAKRFDSPKSASPGDGRTGRGTPGPHHRHRRAASHARPLVTQDRWHLTVAFLGKVECVAIDRILVALQEVAQHCEPIDLAVAGGGRFGLGRYSVVWAGIDGDVESLVDLVGHVRTTLIAAGLNPDTKQFRPHVTLARPGDRITNQQASQDLLTLRRYRGPTWNASELVLFDSNYGQQPKGQSPTYEPLATIGLGTH